MSSAGGQWAWLTAKPYFLFSRRRAHGPGAPNFHYNILAAKSQEKNRKKINKKNFPKPLDKSVNLCYNTYRKKEISEVTEMNKYNLNRIERHYMTEVMLTFEDKHGREMTAEEFAAAVEKMRAKRAR